uniref:uncharacterized protein LOC120334593 n=1 Tax=Styela clava TaxID=7725 RepID=UPI0019393725|nr:uncharacterized protein LOC120334593 [Styela clava]
MRLYFAILIFGLLSVARAPPPDEDAPSTYYCTATYWSNYVSCATNEVTRPCPIRPCTIIITEGKLLATGETVKLEKSITKKTQQCIHNRPCGVRNCKCRDYFAKKTVKVSYSKDGRLEKRPAKIVIRYPAKCKCARKRSFLRGIKVSSG